MDLVDHQDSKLEQLLVDVTDKRVTVVKRLAWELQAEQQLTKHGVHVVVTLFGLLEADNLELLVIVITGQSVVLAVLDKVDQGLLK